MRDGGGGEKMERIRVKEVKENEKKESERLCVSQRTREMKLFGSLSDDRNAD